MPPRLNTNPMLLPVYQGVEQVKRQRLANYGAGLQNQQAETLMPLQQEAASLANYGAGLQNQQAETLMGYMGADRQFELDQRPHDVALQKHQLAQAADQELDQALLRLDPASPTVQQEAARIAGHLAQRYPTLAQEIEQEVPPTNEAVGQLIRQLQQERGGTAALKYYRGINPETGEAEYMGFDPYEPRALPTGIKPAPSPRIDTPTQNQDRQLLARLYAEYDEKVEAAILDPAEVTAEQYVRSRLSAIERIQGIPQPVEQPAPAPGPDSTSTGGVGTGIHPLAAQYLNLR